MCVGYSQEADSTVETTVEKNHRVDRFDHRDPSLHSIGGQSSPSAHFFG